MNQRFDPDGNPKRRARKGEERCGECIMNCEDTCTKFPHSCPGCRNRALFVTRQQSPAPEPECLDCPMVADNETWRNRALVAERRLRALERMPSHRHDLPLWTRDGYLVPGWNGEVFRTLGDCIDAWDRAHPEAPCSSS